MSALYYFSNPYRINMLNNIFINYVSISSQPPAVYSVRCVECLINTLFYYSFSRFLSANQNALVYYYRPSLVINYHSLHFFICQSSSDSLVSHCCGVYCSSFKKRSDRWLSKYAGRVCHSMSKSTTIKP